MPSLALHLRSWITGAPLERVRLLFLAVAIASAVSIAAVGAGGAHAATRWPQEIVLPLALSAYWAWGHRRGRFPLLGEPLEALALFAIVHAAPGEPFLPLFGLIFRSTYGSTRLAFARYLLWAGALLTAHASRGAADIDGDLSRLVGLALVPGLVPALRTALQGVAAGERRLRSIVHHSSDVIAIVDEQLVLRWQSGAMQTVLGHEPETLLGTSMLALIRPRTDPC